MRVFPSSFCVALVPLLSAVAVAGSVMGLQEAQPCSFAFSSLWFGIWAVWKEESSSLPVLQMLSHFVREAGMVGVFVLRAPVKDGCAPDTSVLVAGSCGQWSCTTCGHGYFTAEAAELIFQLPPSLFSSSEAKSITVGLFWHHNPVHLFL